ncbi:MAG: putative competence protein ComEA, partial [Actinomycetota bacterium]
MRRLGSWLAWVGWQRFMFVFAATPVVVVVAWWLVRLPAPPIESMIPVAPPPATSLAGSSPVSGSTAGGSPSGESLAGAPPDWLAPLDTVAPSRVAVHVVGAVQKPGVYHLPPDARADDALRAAGGASPNADLRRVNLASVVFDGEQLYIPRVGERIPPSTPSVGENRPTNSPSGAGGGRTSGGSRSDTASDTISDGTRASTTTVPLIVDLNRATAADLD